MRRACPKTYTEVLMQGLCQFIEGDPKQAPVFCNQKPQKDSVYCEKHHKLCYKLDTRKNDKK